MSHINSKRTQSGLYINKHGSILKCPICNATMEVQALTSLVCPNRHSFDIAKQGYLHLMTHSVKTGYNKSLFEARRKVVIDSGFFSPFHDEITRAIYKHMLKKNLSIVDIGSGEGSHLYAITNTLQLDFEKSITRVGMDISKEGVLEAAKNYEDHMWVVADLAEAPFFNNTFDVILNILSPSNYSEFNRLLKDDGIVIKVIPQKGYLQELRQYFYRDSEKKDYSNDKIIKLFHEKFTVVDQAIINYTSKLTQSELQALIKMTPLSWGASEDKITHFLNIGNKEITVDLVILIGMKKSE